MATAGVSAGSSVMADSSSLAESASGFVVVLSPELLSELENPAVARGSAKSAAVWDECTLKVLCGRACVVAGAGVDGGRVMRPFGRRVSHVCV